MSIVTLTTDLGVKDFYVASIKGKLLNLCPEVKIIDITHQVPPFDIQIAAFSLKNSYKDFPKGSIHIIGVNPALTALHTHVLILHKGHYFIGADNGIFSLLFDEVPEEIYELNKRDASENQTFPVKDVFVPAAAQVLNGKAPATVGSKKTGILEKNTLAPVLESDSIRGIALYIDSMGNITTNISKEMLLHVGKGRDFEIGFRRLDYTIRNLSADYESVPEGEKLAIINNSGHLEVAINRGNASKLFGIKAYDTIRVDFI